MYQAPFSHPASNSSSSHGRKKQSVIPPPLSGEDEQLVGRTVVIVEDEGITQLQLKRLLSSAGMRPVGVAGDGASGVATVLRERPDIVLMDVKMPGDIDGLEAARRILAVFSTCIVIVTAYDHYKQEAFALGACGYVTKPVDGASLQPALAAAYKKFKPQ